MNLKKRLAVMAMVPLIVSCGKATTGAKEEADAGYTKAAKIEAMGTTYYDLSVEEHYEAKLNADKGPSYHVYVLFYENLQYKIEAPFFVVRYDYVIACGYDDTNYNHASPNFRKTEESRARRKEEKIFNNFTAITVTPYGEKI